MNYEIYMNKLDEKRKNALCNQDASKYHQYCNELGMEPEDKFLYERGQVDIRRKVE